MKYKLNIANLLKKYRYNPTVINIITVAVIAVIVKGLAFYKEVLVAGSFGLLSELLDTFFIAVLIPGFISEVFLNAFKSVFIPNYVAEQKSSKKLGAFQSASFLITIGISLFFILISYLFTDVFLELFFSGHSKKHYALIKIQFYYILPCILFWGLTSLLSGLLNIYDEFKYSSVYPALTSIAMVVCLIFFREQLQEKVLAVGLLIGSISQFILLLLVALKHKIIAIRYPDFKGANTIIMFKQIPAKVSSGFLTGLISATDQYFAAQLIIGSIAALNYGLRIPAFFTSIIIMALGNVLLPYFSNLTINNKEWAFKKLYYILKRLFISLVIISFIVFLFSNFIIELCFERGEFTNQDTQAVTRIQRVFLIGIPFTICGNIIVRFLTSINKNAFMAYVSFITVVLNIVLDIILMKHFGVMGIALCTAILQIFRSLIFLKYTTYQHKLMTIN